MGENGGWVLIIIILLLVLWTFSRRRKPRSSKLDTAIAVLSDINYNIKILEIRTADKTSKKNFRVTNWRFYRDRVEFLQPDLVTTINEAFTIAEEFKNKIDLARKNNTLESLQDMQLERLKEPLNQGKKGLVTWLRDNVNAEMQTSTRRNWLGF
jgi:hypothetical protein